MRTRHNVEHVQLACEVAEGFRIDGYPEVLQQVLEQLLENACVHAFRNNSGGQIRITARHTGSASTERLTLELRDDGTGMPPADVARAFEPFFTTAFGQGGCGLGLFVAHSFVSGMLGGSLKPGQPAGRGHGGEAGAGRCEATRCCRSPPERLGACRALGRVRAGESCGARQGADEAWDRPPQRVGNAESPHKSPRPFGLGLQGG